MAYCTTTELTIVAGGANELKQLADHDGDGTSDPAVLTAAIERAGALMDEEGLSKRFTVPLATVPDGVKWRCAELAVLFLREARGEAFTPQHAELKAQHIAWLHAVRDGLAIPGIDPAPEKHSIVVDVAGDQPTTRDVGREKLKGFW